MFTVTCVKDGLITECKEFWNVLESRKMFQSYGKKSTCHRLLVIGCLLAGTISNLWITVFSKHHVSSGKGLGGIWTQN